ncbi:helix-turn-helix transcriptional regulator [Flavobacterium lindanitolerans]|nr:helix-turn-helix transcriptional regulator [Flavobacterium lindanitolerans]
MNYTTFPNNNLCLAIYKHSAVRYINDSKTNSCSITEGNKNFTSRFYGFHKMPFNVNINGCLDQICIIFYPSALRAFTKDSYADLMTFDDAFEEIFTHKNSFTLEQIFEQDDFTKRAGQLELLLLKNLKNELPEKLKEALHYISKYSHNENFNIETLSKKLEISDTTLFRLFKNHLGQNAKSYLKTIRFRNTLDGILNQQNNLTTIAHFNQYYDQAHFINDFKTFSGYSPKQLIDKVSVQQNDLTWIYNKK